MEKLQLVDYFLGAILVWLVVLSVYFIKVLRSWNKLTRSGKDLNLQGILENIIGNQQSINKKVDILGEEIKRLQGESKNYFQKHALIRFNPFEDTGGDQSFIVALMTGVNNGFVISSLHSRNGTRVYAKQIAGAKASGNELSKEEKEVVEKAAKSRGEPIDKN
ncbi:MAG: DUF4446 family protein [Candidatus Curtissbacteria bacterium]|nr:DUF4446 family protein [Candidatus Curtissbacteria bacterium]